MAYDSRVYRVLIASPSDVEEERVIAVNVIQEWNDLHSHNKKITLLPLRWETHTAPLYGKRPQAVINQAIVDECDLVVGIFWTRLGSPTEEADSGTLEEIDRAGAAGKPIMLYFSKVGRDPDEIDLRQMSKLQAFKRKTYPKGLVEHYKSHIDFRDKFSRQLELRVRELQSTDTTGTPEISLEFVDLETRKLLGAGKTYSIERRSYRSLDGVPEDLRERLASRIDAALKSSETTCVPLAISNLSASGIQSLFVELSIQTSGSLEIFERPTGTPNIVWYGAGGQNVASGLYGISGNFSENYTIPYQTGTVLNWDTSDPALKSDRLGVIHETTTGWKLAFEWDALQPRRTRLIVPLIYVYCPESAVLTFEARVFADSFPEPISVQAQAEIVVTKTLWELDELVPKWRDALS